MLRTTLVGAPDRDAGCHGGAQFHLAADAPASSIGIRIDDLMPPAAYAAFRREHQPRLIALRREHSISLGSHMRLQFEAVPPALLARLAADLISTST